MTSQHVTSASSIAQLMNGLIHHHNYLENTITDPSTEQWKLGAFDHRTTSLIAQKKKKVPAAAHQILNCTLVFIISPITDCTGTKSEIVCKKNM